MGTKSKDEIREAYQELQQIDDPIEQANYLTDYLEGVQLTPANMALVNAVAMNLADEL